jgi:hypothetical protein
MAITRALQPLLFPHAFSSPRCHAQPHAACSAALRSLLPRRAPLALALLAVAAAAAAQNATVCATNQLDWYTSAIGETPCRTYERLRQICDTRCAPISEAAYAAR